MGLTAACCAVPGSFAAAQPVPGSATPPEDIHTVAGRILRPGEAGLEPVRDQWVVLHRLGNDRAGPLDSVRTDSRGAYGFRFAPTGDPRALYFAAAVYGGVAYFTPPLADHAVSGEAAEIVVFDTTTRDIPIGMRGRHIVVSAADAGERRSITEVYELSNDTTLTRVSPFPESPPTWRTSLPAAARDMQVASGDVPPEAVTFEDGEVRLVAPLPPGVKQIAYSYSLPASAFPLSVPFTAAVDVLEILVEEPQGSASGARLAEVDAVDVGGRRFRRFLAQDVPSGSVAIVDIPRSSRSLDRRYVLAVVLLMGGTMLVVLARTVRRE